MKVIGLDIGAKRIGIATASSDVKIAVPHAVVSVGENLGETFEELKNIILAEKTEVIIVGLPRNSKGEETKQSQLVKKFMTDFESAVDLQQPIYYQDESLTSVIAEERLGATGRDFDKGKIDSEAAAIILTDYLERNF
ncbi:MAG: Holliday junction resolvase RuvX [Candidatus Nomurabacteria bacterium]|jgi:putative Holliday junction resolvase|nr:Holliday junction resolvase RuvX [Candidatus Nomurabacteria bacterium]